MNVLYFNNSNKKFDREKALQIRDLARKSIGLNSNSVSFELKQTISIIQFIQEQLDDVEKRDMWQISFNIWVLWLILLLKLNIAILFF